MGGSLLDASVNIACRAGINIGGVSGAQTLNFSSAIYTINIGQNVEIGANGKLNLLSGGSASVTTVGGTVINQGTLTESGTPGKSLRGDLDNQGTVTIGNGLKLDKVNGAYLNTGTIIPNAVLTIPASSGAPTFEMNGGSIPSSVGNSSYIQMDAGTFAMNGGTVGVRANGRPMVELLGASLVMNATATGAANIGIQATTAGTSTITGDVHANTSLMVEGPGLNGPGTIDWAGDPVINGTVKFDLYLTQGTTITVTGAGTLTNNNAIVQVLATNRSVRYALPVINHGSITGGITIFNKPGATYDNFGTIGSASQGNLVVEGATFRNQASGTVNTYDLVGLGAQIVGSGTLPRLNPKNGTIVSPGFSPGVINAFSFTPDTASILTVELGGLVAGTGYDQFVTSSQMTANGTLNVVQLPGFTAGLCGQTFDVVVHSSPGGSGSFSTVAGLNPGPGRALRVLYQGTSPKKVTLVGYNPTEKVAIASNPVAVTEGQPGTQYAVCLDHAPGGNVTVTPTADAQVTVSPASLVFTNANWQLPQFFTVTAVDDPTVEAPHTGTVTHAVTSIDPSYNNTPVAPLTAAITDNDGSANLGIAISQAPPPLTLNQEFVVGFRVTNNGPTLSTGSSVSFAPAGGFQFIGVVGANCSGSPAGLTCSVPGVASGAQATFTLTLRAIARGTFQKTITVTGQQPDANLANNTLVRNIVVN